jgi:hypothetical protein
MHHALLGLLAVFGAAAPALATDAGTSISQLSLLECEAMAVPVEGGRLLVRGMHFDGLHVASLYYVTHLLSGVEVVLEGAAVENVVLNPVMPGGAATAGAAGQWGQWWTGMAGSLAKAVVLLAADTHLAPALSAASPCAPLAGDSGSTACRVSPFANATILFTSGQGGADGRPVRVRCRAVRGEPSMHKQTDP